jgi:hypothetical protein
MDLAALYDSITCCCHEPKVRDIGSRHPMKDQVTITCRRCGATAIVDHDLAQRMRDERVVQLEWKPRDLAAIETERKRDLAMSREEWLERQGIRIQRHGLRNP